MAVSWKGNEDIYSIYHCGFDSAVEKQGYFSIHLQLTGQSGKQFEYLSGVKNNEICVWPLTSI